MASGFSTAYSNDVLDYMFNATSAPLFPTELWVAAFKASNASQFLAANDAVSATEVATAGTAYQRIRILDNTGIDFGTASANQITITSDIVWAAATAAWGTVYTLALMTASSGGNVVCYGDLNTSRVINIPDVFRVPAGQFIVAL